MKILDEEDVMKRRFKILGVGILAGLLTMALGVSINVLLIWLILTFFDIAIVIIAIVGLGMFALFAYWLVWWLFIEPIRIYKRD